MKELSLNILDITGNSVKAGAKDIHITISESDDLFTLTIEDNGCGMSEEMVRSVTDPFCTTRTTRKVGLGIPLLKLAAEQTGGSISIKSRQKELHPEDHGTCVTAEFFKNHIDFTPLGDIVSTLTTLIQGSPEIDFYFLHTTQDREVSLNTPELREVLGEDVPLNCFEVIQWIAQNLREQYGDQI